MNLKSLHHVCIQTDNFDESLNFYRDVLGFNLLKQTTNFHSRAFIAWLERAGLLIELQTGKFGRQMNKWDSNNQGPVHLGFLVDNVTEEFKALKASGFGRFKKDSSGNELYEVNGSSLFKMRAPEGTEIEIRDSAVTV